ncbi:hypothetical protein [Spirulina subsalsa]|uniref:hypothetical protein n=1 Tax=Spirulina subsalsa TaxID=54311 RepID=UPI0003094431|nr:hypothetical protein [Spirulina subsalsa]
MSNNPKDCDKKRCFWLTFLAILVIETPQIVAAYVSLGEKMPHGGLFPQVVEVRREDSCLSP